MSRISSPFVLDLRSVALFRILIGSTMVYDILTRFPYVALFLSDAGALSRADLLATVNRPWSFSVYMLVGDPLQVQAILALHLVAALALVVGFRTRLASVVCWVLVVSLQHRNPLVLNGGDTLLSLYAFWAMFLPLNARWSVDRAIADSSNRDGFLSLENNGFHTVPGAAFMLQTLFVYGFTVVLKSGDLWRNGEAVSYAIRNLSLLESGALWLQKFDAAQVFLTYATFHWEWIGCVLVLCPFFNAQLRMVAIFGFVAMQCTFGWMLDLALFPLVSISGWLALLPRSFWVKTEGVVGGNRTIGAFLKNADWSALGFLKGGGVIVASRRSSIICGIAIVLVFGWNLRGLPKSPVNQMFPKPVSNMMYALKLRQKWSMFAANPPRNSGWYTIESQLANGDTIDLFNPQVPYSIRRPELFTSRYPDRRWGKFLDNIRKSRYRRLRDDYLEFLVSRWSKQRKSGNKIQTASLVYFRERILLEGGFSDPKLSKLVTIMPDGITQVGGSAVGVEESTDDSELGDL